MRITIVGGSKGTGARLAEAARDAGHEVTTLSRSGDGPSGVTNLPGDATDPTSLRDALSGADAVVVTVGGAKGVRHHRSAVTHAVVEAMRAEGVRRLVVQSSLGAGDSDSQMPLPLRVVMKALLARPLADHDRQESIVRDSGRLQLRDLACLVMHRLRIVPA